MPTLSQDAQALLDKPIFGTIATVSGSGAPLQVLVWYMRDGDTIVVHTSEEAVKTRNVRARAWASLSVNEGPRYLSVRGRATIESDPEAVRATFRRIVERYVPPEQVETWLARMEGGVGVTIRIPIEHFSGSA